MSVEAVESRILQIQSSLGALSARPAGWPESAGSSPGTSLTGSTASAGSTGSWSGAGPLGGGLPGDATAFSAALDEALGATTGSGTGAGFGLSPVGTGAAGSSGAGTPGAGAGAAGSSGAGIPGSGAVGTPEPGGAGTPSGSGVGTSGAGGAPETGRVAGTGAATGASAATGAGAVTGAGGSSGSASGGSDFGDRIVQAARKHLGVRYVWGGNSPAQGFDCSGLVRHVMKELGVSMPRVARDQAKVGTEIPSLAQARPGDLLGMRNGTHIAIYLGDNKILHAPRPGENVSIRSLHSGDDIDVIRRVTPPGGSSGSNSVDITAEAASTTGVSTRAAFEQLAGAGA